MRDPRSGDGHGPTTVATYRQVRCRAARYWPVLATLAIVALHPQIRLAADDPDTTPKPVASPANKLTVAYYDFSSSKSGVDVNLRHTFSSTTGWIALYHQGDGFDQARAGYEYDYHGKWLTVVPSVQVASHGFVGATL